VVLQKPGPHPPLYSRIAKIALTLILYFSTLKIKNHVLIILPCH